VTIGVEDTPTTPIGPKAGNHHLTLIERIARDVTIPEFANIVHHKRLALDQALPARTVQSDWTARRLVAARSQDQLPRPRGVSFVKPNPRQTARMKRRPQEIDQRLHCIVARWERISNARRSAHDFIPLSTVHHVRNLRGLAR
jgi:hypothetical protein